MPRLRTVIPAAAGAAFVLALVAPLLHPDAILAVRDIPFFHLPLRDVLGELLGNDLLPEWNPTIHGGQPIPSNPNYALFYPPTWLASVLPTHWGIGLLVAAHALWALGGAWWLLRRLGADPQGAALGATAFAGGSWYLSLSGTLNFFCGLAWLPWIVGAGEPLLHRRPERQLRATVLCAAGLAVQLLAGEPVAVLVTGLLLLLLACHRPRDLGRTLPRLAAVAGLAALLAAVQLVPTARRLEGSARSTGLRPEMATTWSAPPERVIELAVPRFWGDPMRDEEGLYFGWGVHDRDYPYVLSVYCGLLTLVVAIAGASRWRIPYSRGWLAAAAAGLFFALGRHNPVFHHLREIVPVLEMVRYPEKFIVLTDVALALGFGISWSELRRRRTRGEIRHLHFPIALAGGVALVVSALAALFVASPDLVRHFVIEHSPTAPAPEFLRAGTAFLRREAVVAALVAIATTGVIALWRSRRIPVAAVSLAAAALLGADLWHRGSGFVATFSAERLLSPPPLARALMDEPSRLFTNIEFDSSPELNVRLGPPGFQQIIGRLARLDPYAGTLWDISYVLHSDYDLMLTDWGRHALRALGRSRDRGFHYRRVIGAWNGGHLVVRRSPEEILAEIQRQGPPPRSVLVVKNDAILPAFRFVTSLEVAPDRDEALLRLAARRFLVADGDVVVADRGPSFPGAPSPARLVGADVRGDRISVEYDAEGPAVAIVAVTYDRDWSARVAGREVPLFPTALGQMAAVVPGGRQTLELSYRDPGVRIGGALSIVTALGILLVVRLRQPSR